MAADDKYGLEPAESGGTATAVLDDKYGLEKAPATPAPQKPAVPVTTKELPGATLRLLEAVNSGKTPYTPPLRDETLHPAHTPLERQQNEFLLGTASGASQLPETLTPITSAIKGYGQELGDRLQNIEQHPITGTITEVGKALADPEISLYNAGKGLYQTGKDIIAPQAINGQDPEEVRAHALGTVAGMAADKALHSAAPEVRTAGAAGIDLAKGGLQKFGEPFHIGMSGEDLLTKGISPRAQATGFNDAINRPGVQRILKSEPIQNAGDLDEALPGMKDDLWKSKVDPALERQKDRPVVMKPAADAVRAVITPEMQEFDPAHAEELEKLADKLEASRDVAGTNRLLTYVNGKLTSYFNKYPSARRADMMKNPDTAGWESARRAIRGQLLDTLEDEAGETQVRDARLDYGALETISKEVERRVNVADRAKPMSLGRILGMLGGAGSAIGGIAAGGRIPGALAGAAVYGLGELATHLNKPDVLIRRGIERLNPGPEPAFTPPAPYQEPLGSQNRAQGAMPASVQPIHGPVPPPQLFELGNEQPNRGALWQQQVGAPPNLTWEGRGPEPIAPATAAPTQAPRLPQGPAQEPYPAMQSQFKIEPIGNAPTDENAIGARGQGGIRIPAGSRTLPAPSWRTAGTPTPQAPFELPKPRPEVLDRLRGLYGRPEPAAQSKPVAEVYSPSELEEAGLMIRSELDMMKAGERPGRMFIENAPEDYLTSQREQNSQKGQFAGGHWIGISSMRNMLPWFKNVSFAPSVVEKALAQGEGPNYEKIMRSAAEQIRKERAGNDSERAAIADEDEGEGGGEVNFMPENETAAAPPQPAGTANDRPQVKFKGGINEKGVEASMRPNTLQDRIQSLRDSNEDMKAQMRSGRGTPADREQAQARIKQNEEMISEMEGGLVPEPDEDAKKRKGR
jgi:hypothetical protein